MENLGLNSMSNSFRLWLNSSRICKISPAYKDEFIEFLKKRLGIPSVIVEECNNGEIIYIRLLDDYIEKGGNKEKIQVAIKEGMD